MSLKKKSHLTLDSPTGCKAWCPQGKSSVWPIQPPISSNFSCILFLYSATRLLCFMTSYIYNNHLSNTGPWCDQIEEKLEVFFFFFYIWIKILVTSNAQRITFHQRDQELSDTRWLTCIMRSTSWILELLIWTWNWKVHIESTQSHSYNLNCSYVKRFRRVCPNTFFI